MSKVLDATLSVLAEKGYQGTTTSLVAATAGVSRGAMLHHFPTRSSLFVATAGRLLESEVAAFRKAMGSIPEGADRYHAAIDFLWTTFQSDVHLAWNELSLGSRSDPEASDEIAEAGTLIHSRIAETWVEVFPEAKGLGFADIAPDFATALLDGLAQRKLTGSITDERAQQVVESLKGLSTLLLAPPQGDPT